MTIAQVPRDRIRVIVAHADPAGRRAVRDALAGEPGIVVAASAAGAVDALELARHYRPEVVLIDAHLRSRRGPALAKIAAAGGWATVALCREGDDHQTGLAALRAGADGVVGADLDGLADAVRDAAAGEAALPPSLVTALVHELRGAAGLRPVRSALTTREWEVLDLLCGGKSTREIAAALHLAEATVYGHVKRILRKLGVRTRADAGTIAGTIRRGAGAAPAEPDHAARVVARPPRM